MIFKILEEVISTDNGEFIETVYTDGKSNAITLTLNVDNQAENLLVRIHSDCISSHVFFYNGCDCRGQMFRSQEIISKNGRGVIIWLDQEGRSNGHVAKMASEKWKRKGLSQTDAYVAAGFPGDARDYRIAVEILKQFSPKSVHILSGNPAKIDAVRALGVPVTSQEV